VSDPPPLRFAAADGLRVRELDDEAIVFEPVSWDAHLLNPAAHAVLALLLDGPRSEAEIVAFLADALQPSERPAAPDHARRLLGELQSLRLIHAVGG
jgi:PqqD family protein of HPr-rel-A system